LSSLLVEYAPNDKVVVKIDPTQVKGMPHRRFNGLVGTVTEVGRRAVTVDVKVGDKVKKLIARKEHVVKMGES
jgi:large subunit ribosomal protein L21e